MSNYVQDKVIIITGSGGGFGRIVAGKVAALGARVVVSDIDEAAVASATEEIRAAGGEAEGLRSDVTDRAQMAALAAHAVEHFGAIDVMVNNAGIMPLALYSDHEIAGEAWDRCIDINFKGVLHGICCVHDQMTAQGRGHVVNISSVYGNYPVAGAAVYGATKAAVNVLSESLRQESQGRIKVTTIRPTGVPGTGLGAGVLNVEAVKGVLGSNADDYFVKLGQVFGEDPPAELVDPEQIGFYAMSPEILADQIVFTINQPWGVSISDLTVRASGDAYMI